MKQKYFNAFMAKITLLAALLPCAGHAQDVYTVESIPYQVYTASLPIEFTVDDIYSDVLSMPFDFKFFGNTYNQFLVSTNGYIDFRTELAGENSPWNFTTTIPDADFPVKNSILGCYHDMDNSSENGNITWSVTGDAPFRQLVLLYNDQPHYWYGCEDDNHSTFQIILYETLNYIDVQITQKDLCIAWLEGNAVIGVINDTGVLAYAAPGRNTGAWQVAVGDGEGWRFKPEEAPVYRYIKCDTDTDGTEVFDLTVVQADLSSSAVFYLTPEDAENNNPITGTEYTNTVPYEQSTIYAAFDGQLVPVLLSMVDCSLAFDNDTVDTLNEDLNADGNLANDDTDGDGLPDFADNDDDGDLVLTSIEYVFGRDANDTLWDTDEDGIPNYLDNDDDNDGILTADEDYNHNGNAADDDTDESGTADYLEANVALGIPSNSFENAIVLYPNPASDVLNISNTSGHEIRDISVYTLNGVRVQQGANTGSLDVSALQSGMYLVKIEVDSQVLNYKFVKK